MYNQTTKTNITQVEKEKIANETQQHDKITNKNSDSGLGVQQNNSKKTIEYLADNVNNKTKEKKFPSFTDIIDSVFSQIIIFKLSLVIIYALINKIPDFMISGIILFIGINAYVAGIRSSDYDLISFGRGFLMIFVVSFIYFIFWTINH